MAAYPVVLGCDMKNVQYPNNFDVKQIGASYRAQRLHFLPVLLLPLIRVVSIRG